MSSTPYEHGYLRVTVKRVQGGFVSNWLCDRANPGTAIYVLPPAGNFTPGSLDADLLLLAAGSGITPIFSILKSVLSHGSGKIALFYANRDDRSVIFAQELNELRRRHPDRLVVTTWLEAQRGLPTVSQVALSTSAYQGREAFVCGPSKFMDVSISALTLLGANRDRIHVERFNSLAGSTPSIANSAAPFPLTSGGDDAALILHLNGQRSTYTWPKNVKLLDLLLARNIDVPYSCREGACSVCACRIIGGKVEMICNDVLCQDDLSAGIVLACQAIPSSDKVEVSYE